MDQFKEFFFRQIFSPELVLEVFISDFAEGESSGLRSNSDNLAVISD